MALERLMRFFILIVCSLALTACATTTPTKNAQADVSQNLKPGECGLFGWSTDENREFIFFANENSARYNSASGPVDLVAQSAFPALDYLDAASNPVTLRLGQGEIMNGGARYPGARLVTVSEDGWERLQPVALVQGCGPKL